MPNATPATALSSAGPALDTAALDRLIASGGLSIPDLTTRRAEFRLYTAAASVADLTNPDTGNPRVRAIGSSTIRDLQGDTMELSALQDMQQAPPGLAIFVNHCYDVPEDLVGRLFDYPATQMKRDIADLALDIEILANVNPRAKQLYAGIQAGVRQGISIGCMITAAQWVDEDGAPVADEDVDFWDIITGKLHLHILGVDPLEWSFVGIPANQRSWVQYAAQGLFRRALQAGEGETAHRLAPLVRAWFPTDFHDDLLSLAGGDEALRTLVGETPPRRGDGKHILWLPGKETFGLRNPQTKRIQELSRERVGALLAGETTTEKHVSASEPTAAPADAPTETPVEVTDGLTDGVTPDDLTADVTPDAVKGATGKSDWPLGERDRAWDGGEAHKRLLDWAGGKDDLDVGKFQSVHFWSPEGDEKSDVSKFKLAYCDDVSGTMTAIPRGIMACWGAHGVEGADIPADDKDAIKKKLSAYAARMREEFDDPDIMPPWDKADGKDDGGKSGADAVDAEKTVSGSGGDLTVKADGTHAAYTGSHSHPHSAFKEQGGDDNHEHEHSHDGDANHQHEHAKSAAPTPTGEAEVATAGVADAIVTAPPVTSPADDKREPDVTGHWAEGSVSLNPAASDSQRAAMLKMFSEMVAPHGFVVLEASAVSVSASAPTRTKDLVDNDEDAQRVITYVSTLDMYLDQASACSDQLMDLLKIPDVDRDDDDASSNGNDNSDVAGPRYPAGISETLGVQRLLTRAGARNSAEDRAKLQTIHDAVFALTEGMCCSLTTDAATPEGEGDAADGADTAGGNGGGQSTTDLDEAQRLLGGGVSLSTMPALVASITEIATTLKAIGLPSIDQQVKALAAAVDAAKAQQDALSAAQERTASEIARLRGMPQGRPTAQMQRSASSRMTASHDALIPDVTAESLTPAGQAQAVAQAQANAKAQTSVQYVAGVGQCRWWPAGVGNESRPAITPLQRMAIEIGFTAIRRALPADPDGGAAPTSAEALIAAYTSGGAALIPIVQDGE